MKHYSLIVATNQLFFHPILEQIDHVYLFGTNIISETKAYFMNEWITFDFCIFDSIETFQDINFLKEENVIITNTSFQTNFENFYCIGKLNHSNKTVNEQLDIVLNHIINPE